MQNCGVSAHKGYLYFSRQGFDNVLDYPKVSSIDFIFRDTLASCLKAIISEMTACIAFTRSRGVNLRNSRCSYSFLTSSTDFIASTIR